MDKLPLRLGILIGGLMGLVYSLVSHTVNMVALPGVPLYSEPPGAVLNILIGMLGGMIMGALVVWPDDAIYGVIAGAVASALFTSITAAIDTRWNPAAVLMLFAYTLLPRAVLAAPIAALLRWAVGAWHEKQGFWTLELRRKALALGVVLGLAILGGLFAIYPQDVRLSLKEVDSFVRANTHASSSADLPVSLQKVPGFLENARGAYTLQTGGDPDALPVQRPIVSYETLETLVIIRFDNGYRLGCVHSKSYAEPICWIY